MAKTVIHTDLDAKWGEKDHLEVSQTKTFTEMIFEMLSEREPKPEETKLLDLILNLSIDHGPDAPSTSATIAAANEGKEFGESVGLGVAEINERHGGAIEPLMELLYETKEGKSDAKGIVERFLAEDKRLPGFGHRIYKDTDPRAQLIMEKAKEAGLDPQFFQTLEDLREEINSQAGKSLPINIDGAIAGVLCGFGWESKLGKAVFIIARVPGLCAHYINNHS
jgi:citrate synthase